MTTAIYIRVSSKSQKEESQLPDCERWAAAQTDPVAWYRDQFTGTQMDRPGFTKLLSDVRSGKITRIVVWRFDRLGRTALGLHQLLAELRSLKTGFVSLRDGFDLGTPTGRMVYGILASVAEYETEVRKERQSAGIEAAREANGGKCPWGGKAKGSRTGKVAEKAALVKQLHSEGQPIAAIARLVGISRPTVYTLLDQDQGE